MNGETQDTEKKELTLQVVMMPILAIAAGTAFLYFAGPILVPLVVAGSLTYLLLPVVNLLGKLKIPHTLAVVIIMILVLGLFILVGFLLGVQIANFSAQIPQYKEQVISTINRWNSELGEFLKRLPGIIKPPENLPPDTGKLEALGRYVVKGLASITNFVIGVVLIFFLTLFMLLDAKAFEKRIKSIFGASHAEATEAIIEKINAQLKGFIQARFYIFLILSTVITIGLLIMGIQYAYIWGPLAGLLNIIPYVGAIIGAIPPIIVAGAQYNSILRMIYVAIFFLVIQNIEGNYFTPKLTSGFIDLNAVTVLISLMYWGWLWGIVGLLVAVPITAAIKVLCDHIESLQPIGIMMGIDKGDGPAKQN
jgi:AI-2 transport protein TqsA